MTTISKETRGAAYARPLLTSPPIRFLALLALCSAYIQGPLMKIYDFEGAIAEMNHFGLTPAPLFAVGVIVFELAMSRSSFSASSARWPHFAWQSLQWLRPSWRFASGSCRPAWSA
ncbi:DoxX protein [Sinorhizobium meliloti]|nr:DoxX protein [Sinorhizobium meliloti]